MVVVMYVKRREEECDGDCGGSYMNERGFGNGEKLGDWEEDYSRDDG